MYKGGLSSGIVALPFAKGSPGLRGGLEPPNYGDGRGIPPEFNSLLLFNTMLIFWSKPLPLNTFALF
jgi:hypothetical protein